MVSVLPIFSSGTIATTGETICAGGSPSIIGNVTAANGGDNVITYSWKSSADNFTNSISGATSQTYTPPTGLLTNTSYRRYAKDGTCNTTPLQSTGTWDIIVNQIVTINAHPSNTVVNESANANFSVTSSYTSALPGSASYQWQVSTNSGSSWTDLNNETSVLCY
jgi:hypothetical protein